MGMMVKFLKSVGILTVAMSRTNSEIFWQGPWLDNEVKIDGRASELMSSLSRKLLDMISNEIQFGGNSSESNLNLRSGKRGVIEGQGP